MRPWLCPPGPERAVAASEDVPHTVGGTGWVAGGAAGRGREIAEGCATVSGQLSDRFASLESGRLERRHGIAYVGRMYVIGRGIEFGNGRARWRRKLTETCRVRCGAPDGDGSRARPIAALDSMFPGLDDRLADEASGCTRGGRARHRSRSDGRGERQRSGEIEGAGLPPAGPGAAASDPLAASFRGSGQLFAEPLAHAKGLDADYPVGSAKVTRAR